MNARRSFPLSGVLPLLFLVTSACATSAPPAAPPQPAALSPALAEAEAIWRARTDSALLRFTPADVRFMTDMIGHHAQALVMSNLAPTNNASPTIQTLAARIVNAQTDEIRIMQRWLSDRRQPVPALQMDHAAHGGDVSHAAHMNMPGMLTAAQLAELAAAKGPEFDRLFLTFMIQHHRGAVVMVDALFATDGAGQDHSVFKFASDVQVDQRTEVARMQQMLDAMGSANNNR
jgi:uncharacterized protein (DUF305 family)